MAGDRARVSFDQSRKWRGLIAQQGRVTVEADWNEAATIAQERGRTVTLDAVGAAGTPDAGYRVTAVPAAAPPPATPGDLTIGQGTLYLGGERLDLDTPVTYSAQPDWLDCSTDPLWSPPAVPTANGTSYELVYLLAFEQEVSDVEDPALADVALGGPDTMQRQRILQRFVRQPSKSGTCSGAWDALVGSLGGEGLQFDTLSMMIESTSALQVSFTNMPGPPSLCQPVATGGYLGAENQMIRVMVASVDAGVPTIVWGFDDASFLYRVQAATYDSGSGNTTLTLTSAPVDSYHHPAAGQAVELLRDAVQLTDTDYIASPAGFVSALTAAYDPATMQLVISGQPPAGYLSAATPQLYLRVWQSTTAAPAKEPTPLGDTGVAVTLTSSTGNFHVGDFWRFALRPIQPAIVYPDRYLTDPQPPDGPRTWACPLGMLTWDSESATTSSCVPPFSNLVELTAAKGGCCTVAVGPSDVGDGSSLQTLLASYANQGPITVCLEPGTYTLSEPLILGPGLDGITLQACRGGVSFQAPSGPGAEFTLGLIALRAVSSVTIRGIELSVPLTGFSPPPDLFSGLPPANQGLLKAFADGLQVAIGISASNSSGLTVEDCTFDFPDPSQANIFGAGIYATGLMDDVAVTRCTFQSANPPQAVPFYDLAAGNQAEPPYQVTFGYLQVPAFSQQSSAPAVAAPGRNAAITEEAAAPGVAAAETSAASAATISGAVAAAEATAQVTTQRLHDVAVEQCLFQGVTVPVLAMTQLGTLRVDQNTVRNSYGGFWLVSLANPSQLTIFDVLAVGNPALFLDLARIGAAALADRIFVIATAIGRVLPATSPVSGPLVPHRIPTPSPAQLALARQTFSAFYAQATAPVRASGDMSTGTVEGASAAAKPTEATSAETKPSDLPPAINKVFTLPGGTPPEAVIPVADTGTTVSPRLDLCDCQVDAVIAGSYSGAGLVFADLAKGAASALVHGNRIRSRFPMGEAAMGAWLAEACMTGNIVANEVPIPAKPTAETPNSCSIALLATATPLGAPAVAVTGNVLIDPAILPTRPGTIPSMLTDWDVLNTVIAYVAPPAVTGISPASGVPSGGDSVTISGSGFTGATNVDFGSASATALSVTSDSQITAASPAGSGIVDITVTTLAGTSAINPADQFTYTEPAPAQAARSASTRAARPAATRAPRQTSTRRRKTS